MDTVELLEVVEVVGLVAVRAVQIVYFRNGVGKSVLSMNCSIYMHIVDGVELGS